MKFIQILIGNYFLKVQLSVSVLHLLCHCFYKQSQVHCYQTAKPTKKNFLSMQDFA